MCHKNFKYNIAEKMIYRRHVKPRFVQINVD